jgi:RNA polymerase sigma factor (TIGR02999 family)
MGGMMGPRFKEVSALLADWSNGSKTARDELIPLVYDELRRLAGHYMALERNGHSLQATALVNEAYLRLVDQRQVRWQGRAHFFALASRMMRRILVDYARSRHYAKRGGAARRVSLEDAMVVSKEKASDVVALDDALTRLSAIDIRKSRVVELRYFGGLTMEEIAEVLEISEITVRRDWSTAKAWLYREIGVAGKASANGK